jgi:dTDP-4-amino-4,6-dideoxygalactose transaminase
MLRVSKSVIGESEQAAVLSVLANEFLGTGPETQAFEQELAAFIGGDSQVVCVNTGTAALQLALQACGIGPGDEVLVPTLTYVASFQAVSATGARPIACDVREEDGLLDLADAERRLTDRTRAVMPVHYASNPGDLNSVQAFAAAHQLRMIEDAAHAFGSTYRGRKIGSFGDITCFSFDGIKNITSGEGGAVVSRDPRVIEQVQDARLLGVERDTQKRYRRERSWDFDVGAQGWRYHMSDIMAAIGRVQLRRFEETFAPCRMALARLYRELLGDLPGLRFFHCGADLVVPHIQPLRILGGKRDGLKAALEKSGIQTGIHYKPAHLLTKFRTEGAPLPVAERLYGELLTVPLHPDIQPADVEQVARLVATNLSA